MDEKDDGGPAFPTAGFIHGMTLRDYFAGQALAGLTNVGNVEQAKQIAAELEELTRQRERLGVR